MISPRQKKPRPSKKMQRKIWTKHCRWLRSLWLHQLDSNLGYLPKQWTTGKRMLADKNSCQVITNLLIVGTIAPTIWQHCSKTSSRPALNVAEKALKALKLSSLQDWGITNEKNKPTGWAIKDQHLDGKIGQIWPQTFQEIKALAKPPDGVKLTLEEGMGCLFKSWGESVHWSSLILHLFCQCLLKVALKATWNQLVLMRRCAWCFRSSLKPSQWWVKKREYQGPHKNGYSFGAIIAWHRLLVWGLTTFWLTLADSGGGAFRC